MPDFGGLSGYGRTSSLIGTSLTAPGSVNTKGAWTQVTSSAPFDVAWMSLGIRAAQSDFALLDIGVGGSGSEQVVIPNVPFTGNVNDIYGGPYDYPISIPAGTRIAARYQNKSAMSTTLMMILCAAPMLRIPEASRIIDWGSDLSTSRGTSCGTSYTQIVGSTDFATRWIQITGLANGTQEQDWWLAVGGSGAEQEVFRSHDLMRGAPTVYNGLSIHTLPLSIPAGTRLSGKSSANATFMSVLGIG